MTWLALVLIGLLVLAVGYFVPFPPPIPVIVRVIGGVMVVLGLILLIMGFFTVSDVHHDDYVGAPEVALVS